MFTNPAADLQITSSETRQSTAYRHLSACYASLNEHTESVRCAERYLALRLNTAVGTGLDGGVGQEMGQEMERCEAYDYLGNALMASGNLFQVSSCYVVQEYMNE